MASEQNRSSDLIILGATPAGITAAIAAARSQKTSIILERTPYIGGLPANGLGATDITTRGTTGGLFLEFVSRVKEQYVADYGADSKQVRDCDDGYHFEPSVAERVFHEWLRDYSKIQIFREREFDFDPKSLSKEVDYIRTVTVTNLKNGERETYSGKFFLDATYEGDLIAAAGVPFFVGREGEEVYGEIGAGRIYKLWYGPECDESTHCGDNAIQAYNYRLCLTDDASNRVEVQKPETYNRSEFRILADNVVTGSHTGVDVSPISETQFCKDIKRSKENLPPVPNKLAGITRLFSKVKLPNRKVDANNQHFAFISSDLPEENWPYPTSSWAWRDQFARRLREYTEGLLYFAQNDPELPQWFKDECKEWGWAKDEYADNGYFPRQVYVREGRRMKGKYIFTANDVKLLTNPWADGLSPANLAELGAGCDKSVPSYHADTITASHYALDSHAVRKYESGRVHLDGFLSYRCKPYSVPYRVMVPDAPISNLLAPVPVSASHIGFSTLRMEPCWMALGHAAGLAAALCIDSGCCAEQVNISKLQRELLNQGAILIYDTSLWKTTMTDDQRAERQWKWLHPSRRAD